MRLSLYGGLLSLALLCTAAGSAQQHTLYMSILSSHKFRLGAADNPIVGLFVSTDMGDTWIHRGWREYIRTFYSEVGPDGTVWSACGNGVLRSTDNGLTWKVTTGWQVTEVLKVRVDPTHAQRVYAATAYGVFRSTDLGATWTEKNTGLRRPFTSDICIDRTRANTIFAATEEGIFKSSDSGDHWSLAGLPGLSIRTIIQNPVKTSSFLAGTEDDGVFISIDRGATWAQKIKGLLHKTVYAIAVDPVNPSRIILGTHGGGIYRSVDGGNSWVQSSEGLKNLDVHSVVIVPSRPDTMFAGTLNGGLFRSTNGGANWEFNSQEDAQVWGLYVR